MPIDPDVAAEITALKQKILKMESDAAKLSDAASADIRKEIHDLRAELAELTKTKGKHKTDDPPPPDPETDPVADLLDGKD
jgi:hypothetical protein